MRKDCKIEDLGGFVNISYLGWGNNNSKWKFASEGFNTQGMTHRDRRRNK